MRASESAALWTLARRLVGNDPPPIVALFLDQRDYLHRTFATLAAREEHGPRAPETERDWALVLERCDEELQATAGFIAKDESTSLAFLIAKALVVLQAVERPSDRKPTATAVALSAAVLRYFEHETAQWNVNGKLGHN